jgi:Flp pilus assembly protein TadG
MTESPRSSQRGQSLVEFAGVIFVLMLLVMIIFDLGRVVYYSSAVINAAREAARYGIVFPDDISGMQTRAYDYAVATGLKDLGTVNACWENYDLKHPNQYEFYPPPSIRVTVTYGFTPVTPLISRLLPGGNITITKNAIMKLEALPTQHNECH